ncbi:alpha/beta hydrolase [Ascidiimonas sp. W6]|uniref:alpha/beta hydrolase n=1 Tax=Ascidiimonas meishanensis TaxID=3128903 RepID=UPI0030EDB908
MKRTLLNFVKIVLAIYMFMCGLLYFFQENLIFHPQKLEKGYQFQFHPDFKEYYFKTDDGNLLHGILFKAANSKGLIFYLHGNARSLKSWGSVAKTYTDLNYDVFILDYRGFGKSEGTIDGEEQLFKDNQLVYDVLKNKYKEQQITILGYSIGTGLASKLASDNQPKQLILQAPYYSLTDLVQHMLPFVPTAILKYKFETSQYLKKCRLPIFVFHGDIDEVIYYGSSLKLKKQFDTQIQLITLEGQSHNGITANKQYQEELKSILN